MDYESLAIKIFTDAKEDPITRTLCIIIGVYFGLALWFPKTAVFRNAGTILPSIGVLGTFIGVLISVSNFKLKQPIDNPLQEIIGGLQVAFVTSIFGLACGIFFRIYQAAILSKDGPPEIGPDEVYGLLKENNNDARENSKKLLEAISGDSDGSLNSQIKLMRQDLNDFGKTVAESNTKAFIKALEKAISDFNENLTEQLGDNFSKLNDAVGNLLIWQENNKKDMEELRQSLDRTTNTIKSTEDSISEIEKSSSKIPENVSGLSTLLEAIQVQLKDVEAHTKVFSEISDKASDALPRIEEVLTTYTQGIEISMSSVQDQFQDTITNQRDGFDNLKTQFEQLGLYMSTIGSNMEGKLSDFASDFDSRIKECLSELESTFDRIANGITDTSTTVLTVLSDTTIDITKNTHDTSADIIKKWHDQSQDIVTEISSVNKQTSDMISRLIKEQTDITNNFSVNVAKFLDETLDGLGKTFLDKINDLSGEFDRILKGASDEQTKQLKQFSDDLIKQFSGSLEDLRKGAQETLGNVQTGLDDLMVQELNAFSQRLGGIANRLSDDYGPLSDNFKRLIEVLGEHNKSKSR